MSRKKITFVMAMEVEAAQLISELKFKKAETPWNPKLPMRLLRAKNKHFDLTLILQGKCKLHEVDSIGSQPAAISTMLACEYLKPDLLINAGTAGGFISRGGNISDVYLAQEKIIFHDRRIDVPKLREYGLGSYPAMNLSQIAQKLDLKTGIVSSGDALDAPDCDLKIMDDHSVVAKDMEAAAIAWMANIYDVPLLVIKSITDLVDSGLSTKDEFIKNLMAARTSMTKKILALLELISLHPNLIFKNFRN